MYRNGRILAALDVLLKARYTDRNLRIESLAELLEISERQFQRLMRAATGSSPTAYLREYRLERARELLRDGAGIGDAAHAVGFSSHAYFSCCFKACYGITPSQFQTQAGAFVNQS